MNLLKLEMESKIIAQLKTVYDPEIPVDVYELGLIYKIDIADDNTVTIDMTLTNPNCPVAGDLISEVRKKTEAIEGIKETIVKLVFEPEWTPDRMSDAARLELDML